MEKNEPIYVAAIVKRCSTYEANYVKACDVARFCRCFNNGFEAFLYLCFGYFIHRAPNAEMLRFDYCPRTGEKIDWDKIYETYKYEFKDYDEKLEDKVKSGEYLYKTYPEYRLNYNLGY